MYNNIHGGRMKCMFIAIIRSDMDIDRKHSYKFSMALPFFSVKNNMGTAQGFEVVPDMYIWRHHKNY
jgi:hypothetical protein